MIAARICFFSVSGIPEGGIKLANALEKYRDRYSEYHLVVDDVLTTGNSIQKEMARHSGMVHGYVVFARGRLPVGVRALLINGY